MMEFSFRNAKLDGKKLSFELLLLENGSAIKSIPVAIEFTGQPQGLAALARVAIFKAATEEPMMAAALLVNILNRSS